MTTEKLEVLVEKIKNRTCHNILQIYDITHKHEESEFQIDDDIQIDTLKEQIEPAATDLSSEGLFRQASMIENSSNIITNITEADKKLIAVKKKSENELIREEAKSELDTCNYYY